MSLSTTDAVRETFREATRQSLTRALRTGEDWDRFQTIVQDTNQRLDAERATFTADYPQRLAEAGRLSCAKNTACVSINPCRRMPRHSRTRTPSTTRPRSGSARTMTGASQPSRPMSSITTAN